MLLATIALSLLATGLFLRGFFLTRRELPQVSTCDLWTLQGGLPQPPSEQHTALLQHVVDERAAASSGDDDDSSGCWAPRQKRRVLLFVVDALRLDFMTAGLSPTADSNNSGDDGPGAGDEEEEAGDALMPRMHALLRANASQTRLFGFRADPPTVTTQRIKGLTAGSLPTFMDLGASFDGAAVLEDTWLGQLRRWGGSGSTGTNSSSSSSAGSSAEKDKEKGGTKRHKHTRKRVSDVLLGDDTWEALFPGHFDARRSHAMASFDTHDLHSVDDGVERLLLPLLRQELELEQQYGQGGGPDDEPKWELFVAHFLGVDHIGHTHSAHSPLMAPRLRRMDRLLAEVAAALPQDALLLVFGDHGMTDDGNHGGATPHETDSGLFVFSPQPLGAPGTADDVWVAARRRWERPSTEQRLAQPRMVSQVDLVPTLSLLLGVPVPYSSLGGLIPELLRTGAVPDAPLLDALLVNALQVMRYLRSYGEPVDGGGASATHDALPIQNAEDALRVALSRHHHWRLQPSGDMVAATQAAYQAFFDTSLDVARRQFTEFDVESMVLGVALLLLAVLALFVPLREALQVAVRKRFCTADPAAAYVAAAATWAFGHALSGISDNLVRGEMWLHAAALPLLALLGRRALGKQDGSPEMMWALAYVLGISLLPRWPGPSGDIARGVVYVSASLAAVGAAWRARFPRRRLGHLSAIVLATCCILAGVHFVAAPGGGTSVFAARGALLLSVASLLFLVFAPGTANTARYLHAAVHASVALGVTTGPLLLPLVLAMTLHVHRGAGGVLHCLPPRAEQTIAGDMAITAVVGAVHISTITRTAFFASGHALAFGALQADAGLVGAHAFSKVWAGLMLAVNSFGLEVIVVCVCVPWLSLLQRRLPRERCETLLLQALATYRTLVLLVSCLTALVLRRHLMVWAVFAPKLAFEAAFWVVQAACICGLRLLRIYQGGKEGVTVALEAPSTSAAAAARAAALAAREKVE